MDRFMPTMTAAEIENDSISECMDTGANGFIGKPYRLCDIIETLKKVNGSIFN